MPKTQLARRPSVYKPTAEMRRQAEEVRRRIAVNVQTLHDSDLASDQLSMKVSQDCLAVRENKWFRFYNSRRNGTPFRFFQQWLKKVVIGKSRKSQPRRYEAQSTCRLDSPVSLAQIVEAHRAATASVRRLLRGTRGTSKPPAPKPSLQPPLQPAASTAPLSTD